MPSTSAKQAKFMRAVAHSPKFAKKVGVSQSVGKDFEMADKKMKKFGGGGKAMTAEQKRKLAAATAKRGSESRGLDLRQGAAAVKSGVRNVAGRVLRVGDAAINGLGGVALTGSGLVGKALGTKDARDLERARGAFRDVAKSAKAVVMGEPKGEDIVSNRVNHRGADADWAKKEGKAKGGKVMKKSDKAGRALVKKSADTMGRAMMKKAGGGKCYAKGGSVSSRADGVAKKGKTNTKHVAMRKGGSC